jgi:hypothetical protein
LHEIFHLHNPLWWRRIVRPHEQYATGLGECSAIRSRCDWVIPVATVRPPNAFDAAAEPTRISVGE